LVVRNKIPVNDSGPAPYSYFAPGSEMP